MPTMILYGSCLGGSYKKRVVCHDRFCEYESHNCTVQYYYCWSMRVSVITKLGPLRGGTIEFALCAVEGTTGKGIVVVELE
jgi:hypothetical protein